MALSDLTRRSFVKLAGATGAGLTLAACGGGASNSSSTTAAGSGSAAAAADGSAFMLGGIGPITGAAAIYGNATKYGAQVAVDEVNAGTTGVKFELNWQDDEHDPEKSVNAYNTLKDWGMQILVGTTTTGPCVAVSAETNADRIFQLTPSASSTDVIGGVEGTNEPRKDNVFQMCFTDPNQGVASAQYISSQKLGTKIAVIYNNADAYSTGIYNKFMSEAASVGLEVVSETTFTDDTTDFTVQLNDAKGAGADLVFLPIYYTPASIILKQANDMGYAPKFFGVDGMDGILTLEGFDTSLAEGVMLLTPFVASADDDRTKAFVEAYKKAANSSDDPNQFAADAYDCVMALAEAIARGTEDGTIKVGMAASDLCEALIAIFTSDGFFYDGLTGEHMTWSDTGEVSKDPKGMIIQNGVYVAMD
jgi:branched-chain amino acid transport system substrate-binding protein